MNVSDAIEEWASRNRVAFEHMYQTLARASEEARDITVAVTSSDGGVRATVGADRRTHRVEIAEKAYLSYDEAQLAAVVTDTVRRAKRGVAHAEWHIIHEEFGISRQEPRSFR